LSPYFIDPEPFNSEPLHPGKGILAAQTAKFMIKTVLMDPYTPIHLYSGILPIKSLQIPEWSLGAAMKNMTAFFTMGPLLVTKDVRKVYDGTHPLKPDSWLAQQNHEKATTDAVGVKFPIAGGKGMWKWLQPYPPQAADPTSKAVATASGAHNITTSSSKAPPPRYNAFEVGQEDGRLRHDPGPYTLLEGFLQLARPLIVEQPPDGLV
jgi:hypothetical protein